MELFISTKKAQAWSLDLTIASIIFTIGIIILFVYGINFNSQSKNKLDEFFYEGNSASDLILNEGYPGILSGGKINQTKLEELYSKSYSEQKRLLRLRNNFFFTFDGLQILGSPVEYVGKINDSLSENLIQVGRLSIYENSPIKFKMFIWD